MLRCWAILLVGLSSTSMTRNVANALKEIPLPHLDIFMLCSNDIRENLDYVLELDGFYTDLLPAAVDISIDGGSQEFKDCAANENRTQVIIAADGVALFGEETPLDQVEIQALVTNELLSAYFQNICKEMDTFEALISEAGTEPQVGIATAIGALVCDFDDEFVEAVARTGLIVTIVSLVIICLCICGCILFCCGACT